MKPEAMITSYRLATDATGVVQLAVSDELLLACVAGGRARAKRVELSLRAFACAYSHTA